MPKIFIHSPEGTFDVGQRQRVAQELTDFALACEALPASPFVKSTVWTYFNEYAANDVFMGHVPATAKVISAQIYVLEGGLDAQAKKRLIEGVTEILGRKAGLEGRIPAFLVIHETPELNWGIFGGNGNLAAVRASAIDLPAM